MTDSASKTILKSNKTENKSILKYLTEDPQMTYFKSVYKRHTDFSFDYKEITPDKGKQDFGNKLSFKISNLNYDMVQDCVLKIVLPQIFSSSSSDTIHWIDKVGHAIIKRVTLSKKSSLYNESHWF